MPSPENSPGNDLDRQIKALTEIVGALASRVSQLDARVDKPAPAKRSDGQDDEPDSERPAAWVWFTPPEVTENHPDTVHNFVTWYNATYVGLDGSRAKPIPSCWWQHPGLAMEVATLAHSWRAANIGPSANPREAQSWHHQWRPGFTERLAREWAHPDCIDGEHRTVGAPERADRFVATK